MSDDLARMAAGLTDKQREALMTGRGSIAVCRALKRKGLADWVEGTGMAWVSYPQPSVLGLSLRRYLKEQADEQ